MPTAEAKMFAPRHYRAQDPRAIVSSYPFATLFSATADGMFATMVPIYFETDAVEEQRLVGHLARANPHAATMVSGDPVLAVFAGPHAYVSAGWYRERPTVPTWNYLAVQARGTLDVIDDDAGQLALMERTQAMVEHGHVPQWTMDDAPPGWVATLLPRIRSFRITLTSLEGATKLSQQQPSADRLRVIEALESRNRFGDREIADEMRVLDGLPRANNVRPGW